MAITEEPSLKDEQEEKIASESSDTKKETRSTYDYDVLSALKATGHTTRIYPNGLVLGVHIEGIPGRRGVHVDVVYVLDLRHASFGKATLAMQAAVLETLNRNTTSVLQDVEIEYSYGSVSKLTTKGKILLPMLKANPNHPGTMIHPTRTVYVIIGDERPKMDLSWLTEPSRVLHADDFLLARRSDMRSFLSEMQNRILVEKWKVLGNSIRQGWFGVLSVLFAAIGIMSLGSALMIGESSILIPLIATSIGSLFGLWMLRESRKNLDEFNEILLEEQSKINRVGDGYRIDASILENEDKLNLQRDLGFVVSPLLASAAGSVSIGDYDDAVASACLVLDECVRFSQKGELNVGDDGLGKFLGLFQEFNGECDEDELSICYAGLSNHLVSPLSEDEVLRQCTVLSNALYDIGILRPAVKDRIDDLMNQRAMKENLRFLDQVIQHEDETKDSSKDVEDDSWFLDEMLHEKSISKDTTNEIPEIVAETHPDDLEEEEDIEHTARQLDELSDLVNQDTSTEDLDLKASDVVNSVRSKSDSKNTRKKDESLEDDITAR